jgi:hypothetical protein
VVILGGAAALGCLGAPSGPIGFDERTGCCVYDCGNGCGTGEGDCPDTGEHADATCTPYIDDTAGPSLGDEDGDGFTPAEGDCDEKDASVNPAADETCDGIDNDCDDEIDEDLQAPQYPDSDGDGFGSPTGGILMCPGTRAGYVTDDTDCDDTNAAMNPAATESCDGLDDDCDGAVDEDCP